MRYVVGSLLVLLLLALCSGSNVAPIVLLPDEPIVPGDFNITGLTLECDAQIAEISISSPEDYKAMFHAWGRSMGDTGKFYECSQIPEAEYCLAMLDVVIHTEGQNLTCSTKIPQCNLGVCVPSKCSQNDVSMIISSVRDQIGSNIFNGTFEQRDMNWLTFCQVDTSLSGNPLAIVGLISLLIIICTALGSTILHMATRGKLGSLFSRVEVKSFPTHKEESEKETISNLEFKGIAAGPSDLNLPHEQPGIIDEVSDDLEQISLEGESQGDSLALDMKSEGSEEEELEFTMKDQSVEMIDISEVEAEEDESLLIQEQSAKPAEEIRSEPQETEQKEETELAKVIPKPIQSVSDCFSISSNYRKLLNPIPGEFGSLNGLRFFSMMWVIWGHTLFFWAQIGAGNLGYAYGTFIHQFYIQAAMSGIFAVDSFFFLSGFLGSYFLYERLVEGKRMEWFLIYFHRFWRILPVYTFIMLIYVTVLPVLGDGPFWFKLKQIVENTSPNCWSNLIFINNLYPPSSADQCMGWGWFLAVDMQFFLVSPFLIYIYYKYPKIGLSLLGIWLVQDLSTSTILSYVRGYSPSIIKAQPHFFEQFYQRPYCRAAPYIVGLSCGYLYSYLRRNRPDFRIPMPIIHIGYGIALSTIAVIVYSIYWDDQWNQFENSLYLGFSRFAWGLSIAFLNMTMFLGYGGLLRKFFFARVWQPLAKLTYGAYLSHPIFMWLFYFNQWQYIFIQNRNVWYYYIGHAVCAFSFAVIAYLLVEKPFMNLEPILIKGVIRLIFKIRNKPLPKEFQ